MKVNITLRGNKALLRYFRNFNNTSINENKTFLEYQTYELKVPCLPQSMLLLAFHISHSLNAKGHAGSEKIYSNFIKIFTFQMLRFGSKYYAMIA